MINVSNGRQAMSYNNNSDIGGNGPDRVDNQVLTLRIQTRAGLIEQQDRSPVHTPSQYVTTSSQHFEASSTHESSTLVPAGEGQAALRDAILP